MSDDLLSTAELEAFNRDGVMGPFKIYEATEAKAILHRIRMKNIDNATAIHKNDVDYDRHFDIPELTEHIAHPAIVKRVRGILGHNVLCWRTEFFPKFPGSKGTEWHQVANYQYATGRPMLVPTIDRSNRPLDITVWTAFTRATKDNGCMKFIPGSHQRIYYDESKPYTTGGIRDSRSIETNGSFFGYEFQEFKVHADWDPETENVQAIEMEAGECLIFTAKCVHASYPNTTKRETRFAITARYVPTDVRVYPYESKFRAHGGLFDLDASDYGCVLVSGTDTYGHNRIRHQNELGQPFPYVE